MGNFILTFPSLLMILVPFVFFGNTATAFFSPTPPPPMQVFILAGQSNMAGRGGTSGPLWDEYVPKECAADPMIYRLNADNTWELAYEPLHRDIGEKDKNKTCGIGPAMSFANTIKDRVGGARIGLVPCAIGGSRIDQWAKGNHTYDDMVRRANLAAVSGQVRALLWYQGESDTSSIQLVNIYKEKMISLIPNVREDLNLPWLPIIQVAIASGGDTADQTLVDELRAIQKGIKVPNVICVDALGLALNGDHVHLTTASQVTLGQMLGEAYLNNFNAIQA